MFSTAAGLTALFAVVPILYEGLKLLGALYLIWLGAQIIFFRAKTSVTYRYRPSQRKRPATFLQSVLVEVLNPTTAIFYVAFLPQFIAPEGDFPVWFQFMVLGVVVNLIFTLPDLIALFAATKVKGRIASSARSQRIFRWMGGSVLVCLGLRLAADRN